MAKCPPAVSGSRGHDQAFAVACALVNGFALDEADAMQYFVTYNAICCPPWKERDLRHKLKDATEKPHDKPRGHLIGDGANWPVGGSQSAAKPVPVRLTAKNRQFRTGRTTFFNPYAYAGEKTEIVSPYIEGVGAKPSEASEEGVSVESEPLGDVAGGGGTPDPSSSVETRLSDDGLVAVPGCRMKRPEEITLADADWQKLDASGFAAEPLVQLAAWMFGPCKVLSTGRPTH